MKTSVFASTLLLGTLAGCATSSPQGSATAASATRVPVTVAPAPAAKPNMPSSEASYLLALRAHGQGQLRLAAEHYARTLAADDRHVGAHNGLGVIRAQEGRIEEALALFARSRELSPKSAHVHNNLGYTLLQADRLPEARLALKLAMELDPSSLQTLQNLRLLADAERRAQAVAADAVREQPVVNASGEASGALVVVAPQIYELRASAPPVARAPSVGAVEAVRPAAVVAAPSAVVDTATQAPTVTSSSSTSATTSLASTQVPALVTTVTTVAAAPATPVLSRMRLEVTNGAGVERLARRTAGQLAKSGVRVSRLTNQMPYRQVRTQIRYVAGQEAALQALVQHLPVSVERVAVVSLPAGMQLKLVLGRDFNGQAIAAWIDQQDAQPVAVQRHKAVPLS